MNWFGKSIETLIKQHRQTIDYNNRLYAKIYIQKAQETICKYLIHNENDYMMAKIYKFICEYNF